MKKWILFSLMSVFATSALADGTITCKGFDAKRNKTEDVLMIEADIAILLTVSNNEGFLSPRWQNGQVRDYANDKYVVTVDHNKRTITTENRLNGAKQIHTDAKCRYNGEPDEDY